MNLVKLFELQKALDEKIVKEKGLEGQDLLPKKILALQVELGELANEWQGFKMWKVNPQPKPGMLEEYCDCLHFILSIGWEIQPNITEEWGIPQKFEYNRYSDSVTDYFNLLFGSFNGIENRDELDRYEAYWWSFEVFAELGEMLGFTWEQIEQAYLTKNEINHQRQATGY